MIGSVFMETLRRSWKQMAYWGMGMAVLAFYPFLMMPSTPEGFEQYVEIGKSLPEGVLEMFGMSDIASIGTPEGFIGYSFFGYILLVLAVYSVIAGLNVSAVDEDNNSMDMLLSLPLPRWHIITEKVLAYSVMAVGIALFAFIGFLFGAQIASDKVNLSWERYLIGTLSIVPGTIFMLAVTAFIGTLVRRRSNAAVLAGGFIFASYVLNVVGGISNTSFAETMKGFSFFAYLNTSTALTDGVAIASALALIGVSALLTVGAVMFFERRDVSV
jgi:ABC-2 type transport system permease protein